MKIFFKALLFSIVFLISSFFISASVFAATQEKIIFSNGSQIEIMNPDGSGLKTIGYGENPSFSPDGTKIVYMKREFPAHIGFGAYHIFTMNADGTNVTDVTLLTGFNSVSRSPKWSPDGTQIAYFGSVSSGKFANSGIVLMNPDGTNVHLAINASTDNLNLGNEDNFSWSPDGTQMAVKSGGTGDTQIATVNIDGSNLQLLTAGADNEYPSWSPDGAHIAWIANDTGQAIDDATLSTMNTDGTGRNDLTTGELVGTAWSPDSSQLAYTQTDGYNTSLYKIAATGGTPQLLYQGPVFNPSWGKSIAVGNYAPVFNPMIRGYDFTTGSTFAVSGSFQDPDSTSWTGTVDYGDGSPKQPLTISGTNFSLHHVYTQTGTYLVTISLTDNQGAESFQTLQVSTEDAGPTVNSLSFTPQTPALNMPLTFTADFSDPYADINTTTWDFGDGTTGSGTITGPGEISAQHTYSVAGLYNVIVTVRDVNGISASGVIPVTFTNNTPPVVNPLSGATINEGGTYIETGSFTDADSNSWTGHIDYGDGDSHDFAAPDETVDPINHTFTLHHIYKNNNPNDAPYTATVTLIDNQGATSDPVTASVIVHNVTPTVGTVTLSPNPVQINTGVTATANFTDPGILDTHTATIDWYGTSSTSPCSVTESNGSGTVSCSLSSGYASANVYPVTITVTDEASSGKSPVTYASVYNPTSQGLFSAGSKYTSPQGAYVENPSLTGDVKFGLSYKYQGTMPVGDKQFTMNFKTANLTFNATAITSLVIANNIGTLTGTGTVSGSSDAYSFLVTGSEINNTIRIKITDTTTNTIIYDTQPGAADTATPLTSVQGHVLAH